MSKELRSIPLKRRMAEHTLRMICSALVEAIHVELPYKRVDFAMTKVFG